MKKLTVIAILICGSFFLSSRTFAQITIQQPPPAEPKELEAQPDQRFATPQIETPDYTTRAIQWAQRRELRKQRNTFNLTFSIEAKQTQFSNWAKGGDNTFNGLATLDIKHEYKREKLTYTTRFGARYGTSVIDGSTFKNEDKFDFKFQTDWKLSRLWSLSGVANLRSQFTKGYKSRTDHTLVSDFMSPGILDLSLGFTFKPQYWQITLSPVTGSMLFVLSDSLSSRGINGIEPGKHFKPMIGPSLGVEFDRKFAKDLIHYRSVFNTFWNFTLAPNARWENTLKFQATKWLGTSVYWYMIYDKEAKTPRRDDGKFFQVNYSIGLALTFTYKNK